MKFVCDSCNTKYSIADERVHGRVLKIRCKTCDHVITVREEHKPAPGNIAEALGRGLGSDAGDDHTVVSQMAMSPPPVEQPADEWYVSFDGEQEGPMPLQRAHERVRAERPRGKEAHCWRPGFFVWLAVEEVPEFAPALQKPRPPVRPAVKPAPPVVAKPKSPSGAQAVLKSPTGSQPVLPEQIKAETPRAPEPPKAPGPPKELPKLEPLPAIDSKPMALPPPPGPAVETATPLNLPLPLIPAPMPPTDSIPSGPMAVQVTRPEPRLTRKQLEEKKPEEKKPEKLEEKKPPEEKKEEKKIEPLLPVREPSAPEVSPFVAALAAAKGEEPKPPFDTGPVPLPPPPGSEADLAFSEPSGVLSLSHLPQPSLARSLEKPAIDTFGGVAVTPPGSNGTASAAPVVVVAGPVQSTAPWVKYTIGVLLVLVVSLGAMLIYKSRGPAPADKPVAAVPQPASTGKHVDDKPIQVADPAPPTSIGLPTDVKKPPPQPKHAVTAKSSSQPKLSDNQKNLAALYGDSSGEKGTPKNTSIADTSAHVQAQVSEASIMAVVTQNRRALNTCYDRVLKHDSSLKRARLVTHVKVGISGAVKDATVQDPEYASSEIAVCLTQAIKHWHFPAADAEYETQFPIILQAE